MNNETATEKNTMKTQIKFMVILIGLVTCFIIIEMSLVSASCQMPKHTDSSINIKGKTNSSYDSYGSVMFNKNQVYIYAVRLEQKKDYQIVAISGKNITCIKKVKSYGSLRAYCDNGICGFIDSCFTLTKKTSYLKTAKYYVFNAEDVDCKNLKIIRNKPLLK